MMRSKHFLGVIAAGAVVAAVGCGSSDDTTATSGSGGSSSTTTTTTGDATTTTASGTGGGTTTSSGTGGTKDDGNNSFDTAEDITIDDSGVQADLDPIDSDVDYYKFTGTKDQALFFFTDAKPDDDPLAEGYPDLVITLYDENKQQIALNDDPSPQVTQDSRLRTVLPADGTYYVKVVEFCASDLAAGQPFCDQAYTDSIFSTAYALGIFTIDPSINGVVAEAAEPNDTALTAAPMEYELIDPAIPGQYYLTDALGTFTDAADVDGYIVNVPSDLDVSGAAPVAEITALLGGVDGSGSTTEVGLMQLIDTTSGLVYAEANASLGGDLTPPIMLGHDYLLLVKPATATVGANPFYFLDHRGTGFLNQVEAEIGTGMNDTALTAEALAESVQADSSSGYFSAGDLLPAGIDTDWYKFDVIGSGKAVTVACGAQRSGSGIRGMKFTLLKGSDGTALAGGQSVPEDVNTDVLLQDVDPAGESTLILKIEAASQDAMVTSTFYRCGANVHDAGP